MDPSVSGAWLSSRQPRRLISSSTTGTVRTREPSSGVIASICAADQIARFEAEAVEHPFVDEDRRARHNPHVDAPPFRRQLQRQRLGGPGGLRADHVEVTASDLVDRHLDTTAELGGPQAAGREARECAAIHGRDVVEIVCDIARDMSNGDARMAWRKMLAIEQGRRRCGDVEKNFPDAGQINIRRPVHSTNRLGPPRARRRAACARRAPAAEP